MSDIHADQDNRPAHLQVVTSEGQPTSAQPKTDALGAFAAFSAKHGDTPIGMPSKKRSRPAPAKEQGVPSEGPFGGLHTEGATSDTRTAAEPLIGDVGDGPLASPLAGEPGPQEDQEKDEAAERAGQAAPGSTQPDAAAEQGQPEDEPGEQNKAEQQQQRGVTHAGVAVAPFAGLGAGLGALSRPLRRVASASVAAPKAVVEAGSRSMANHQYVETQRAQLQTSREQIRKNHSFLQEAMKGAAPEHFDDMCERIPSMKEARDANRKHADGLATMLDDAKEWAKSSREVKSWLKSEAKPAIEELSRDTADSHDKKFLERVNDLVDRLMEFIKQLFQRNPGKGARPSP